MEKNCDNCKYSYSFPDNIPCSHCWVTYGNAKPQFTPKTNGDRIRSMKDEKLTSFFIDLMKGSCPKPTSECFGECEACWLDWLKEEVKDGET